MTLLSFSPQAPPISSQRNGEAGKSHLSVLVDNEPGVLARLSVSSPGVATTSESPDRLETEHENTCRASRS